MGISAIESLLTINVNFEKLPVDFGASADRAKGRGLFGGGSNRWAVARDPQTAKRAAYFDAINGKDSIVHFAHLYGPTVDEGPRMIRGRSLLQIWQGIPIEIQADLNAIIEEVRTELTALKRPDEYQAIQSAPCDFTQENFSIEYTPVQFSVIEALRRFRGRGGKKVFALPTMLRPPRVLSANVLMVSPETREIILQLRGDVATYPHHLHIFGGAFKSSDPGADDGNGHLASDIHFLDAAMRELKEETGHLPTQISAPMFVMSREVDTGYVQFNLLGLGIPRAAAHKLRDSWEGRIARIPFDDLGNALGSDGYSVDDHGSRAFVPSGRALILAWLAEGAPTRSLGKSKRPLSSALGSIEKAHAVYTSAIKNVK